MNRGWGNLFWDNHSADLLNFGHSQTISLVSRPKFSKSHESTTAITSIVFSAIRKIYTNLNILSVVNPTKLPKIRREKASPCFLDF